MLDVQPCHPPPSSLTLSPCHLVIPHAAFSFLSAAEMADDDGLLAVGGRLTSEWLLDAYSHGIFPWPAPGHPLLWWSPDPRAIIELDGLHVSRRLERTLRGGQFEVACDRDFAGVMQGCATAQDRGRPIALGSPRPCSRHISDCMKKGMPIVSEAWSAGQPGRRRLRARLARGILCGVDVLSRARRLEGGVGASRAASPGPRLRVVRYPAAHAAHRADGGHRDLPRGVPATARGGAVREMRFERPTSNVEGPTLNAVK